jgi:hypothetical protein
VTTHAADRVRGDLLVRMTPTQRADLERVRVEMGHRTLADTIRALPQVWDALVEAERRQTTKAPV